MDLTSGCPFWPIRDGLIESYPGLDRDLRCDVAVIGGGITGAFIAAALCREGVDVVLLDKRDMGTGSSAGCTGLLQYEIDLHLVDLIDRIGGARAVQSYRVCLEANEKLARLTRRLADDCGFVRRKSVYLASHRRDVKKLEREHAARVACGIQVDLLGPRDVRRRFPFSAPAALLSHDAGEIDAFRLTHALLRRARRDGLHAFDRTRVTRIVHHTRGAELHTDRRHRVRARRIVFAAGYETGRYLKDSRVSLKTTYALMSEPVTSFDGWWERCLLWETARPYFYARTTDDHRICIGGGDDEFINPDAHAHLLPRKTERLRKRLNNMFPAIAVETAYRWAGVFGESEDGLPFIGPCSKVPNSYFAVGYGGNGITYSLLAGEIIRDLFLGRRHPAAHLFRFDR